MGILQSAISAKPQPPTVAADRIVLLFCHGGSYNKECWYPIIDDLQASPILQQMPCVFMAFDWRYHGKKSENANGIAAPKVSYLNGKKSSPRVDHPLADWPEWAPLDLLAEIEKLRGEDTKLSRRTHIIGIGHSMGATSILKLETTFPGTLDGIIAFEPVYALGEAASKKQTDGLLDMLVKLTLAREAEWDTWQDVMTHMKTSRTFRRWNRKAVDAFLRHGLERTADGKRYKLVVSPTMEAAVYCHEFVQFSADVFARAQCKIVLEHGERTVFFHAEPARQVAAQLEGKLFISEAIKKTTHSLVVEDPEACARNILADLAIFPVIQKALSIA